MVLFYENGERMRDYTRRRFCRKHRLIVGFLSHLWVNSDIIPLLFPNEDLGYILTLKSRYLERFRRESRVDNTYKITSILTLVGMIGGATSMSKVTTVWAEVLSQA
jgi:hypothetical protein